MAFENILGQKQIKTILTKTLQCKRIPHALLFHGMEGVGKEAMALELAKALICQQDEHFYCNHCNDCRRISKLTHPDVIFIFPSMRKTTREENMEVIHSIVKNPYLRLNPYANPSISIEQIRELKRTSALTSFENKGRVVIIAEAHRMTEEAENSLLKILEEPPGKMTIILTSSQPNLFLPTIISRCQTLRFAPIAWEDIELTLQKESNLDDEKARLIAKLSFGSYRRAFEILAEDLDKKRQKALDLLRIIIRDDFERLLLVEKLVREEDKKSILDILKLLMFWFRDALIYTQENSDKSLIINLDQMETLEKFCHSFEEINYEIVVNEIEKSIELFERNVFLNLILLNLFYSLKHNLRRK